MSQPPPPHSTRPVVVLGPESHESRGKTAQQNNIAAARLISAMVRTSLGPRGMDKMLISDQGVVTITNDGATMLKEMSVQHPAGKILIEVSKATDTGVGDGTTSAVVLAGALLDSADELLRMGIHPVSIVDGYSKAARKALETLERIAIKVDSQDRDLLQAVARTSMHTKAVARNAPKLAEYVVDAVLTVADKHPVDGNYAVSMKNIKVEKKAGESVADSLFIRGIVLDQKVAGPSMPRRIERARIALMNVPFQIESTEAKSMITIRDASLVKKFIEEETAIFKSMADRVKQSGANVVICQKAMDDVAKHFLARQGILAVEKAYEYEMPRIARAIGARAVTNFEDLRQGDLGYADLVEEKLVGADRMLFVEGCRNPKAVTILVRGGSQRVIEEAERSIHDALMVTKDVLERPYLLAGGGAPEAEASFRVREWAGRLEGREQLAAEKYADALEQIPLALAQNAGMDLINTSAELRARHAEGGQWYGVDALHSKVRDMNRQRVFEPLAVKRQVVSSATEAASMLLRIDNIITMVPTIPPRSGAPQMGPAPTPPV